MSQTSCAIIKEEDAEKVEGFLSFISKILLDTKSRELNRSKDENGNILFVGPRNGCYYLLFTDNMISKPHAIINYFKKREVGCVISSVDHLSKLKKSNDKEKNDDAILRVPDDILKMYRYNSKVT